MPASIPASAIVSVIPNVLAAGGTGLDLSGLLLTRNTRVPGGTVQAFTTAAAVTAFFGAGSLEAIKATVYFSGFDNSNIKPAQLLFAQYSATNVPAYLRGGNVSALTIAQLQALSGVLTLTVNGAAVTSGTINLTSAGSFSAAAALIQTGLGYADAVVTGSITGTVFSVTAVASGALAVGQAIAGTGITAGTTIVALGTGTGGVGTYTVSTSQTATSTTVTAGQLTVSYDSVSGAFVVTGGTPGVVSSVSFATGSLSTGLLLTAATGAVQSVGIAAGVPATFMAAIVAQTQNFVSFLTTYEPVTAEKVAFAAWASSTGNRYLYIMVDSDVTVTTNANTASAGYAIQQANYAGVCMFYSPTDLNHGIFVAGAIASIDFTQLNGRTNLCFKGQSGLAAGVTNQQIAAQLMANGYNFYGTYGTANQQFTWLYPGTVTGPFLWLDSFVNEVKLTNDFQLNIMNLLGSLKSIPYNTAGYGLIEASVADTITAALAFGTIRAGVTLSALQKSQVNLAAGTVVDTIIAQRGWYLSVIDASPAVRAARGSPPMAFFYTDGQSLQRVNLASVSVQ